MLEETPLLRVDVSLTRGGPGRTACNMSGMTMAQSTIAAELDAYEEAMWFTSAYLIALSSLAPLAGRLATLFPPRALVLGASTFFAAGGLVTAAAGSLPVFLLGRVVTGVGGAGVMVLALVLVLELTSKRRRGLFVGLVNAGFTTGVSLGAVVAGLLVPTAGWRALFWAQVPAGLAAGLGVYFSIPRTLTSGGGGHGAPRRPGEGAAADDVLAKLKRIDYLGAALLTGAIVLFLYGLSGGSVQWVPMVVSAGTLVAFVAVEHRVAEPIVPLAVLRSRGALLSCLSQLGFMSARWTILYYAPITALAVFGFSPGASGSLLVPTNLGFGLGGVLVGALHVRRAGSFYAAALVSILLFGLTLAAVAPATRPGPAAPLPAYVAVLLANGLATGAALNYTLAHLLHLTRPDTHYVATSLLGTFRGFAGSFGTAIGGGLFVRTLRARLERGFAAVDGTAPSLRPDRALLVKKLIGSPALVYGGGLSDVDRGVAVQGYVDALRLLFQAASALTVVVLLVQAATGWKAPDRVVEDPDGTEHNAEFEA